MEESRFEDKILTYKDAGKAVKGGEYYFSDNFYELSTDPQGVPMGTLKEVNVNLSYPFTAKESGYSYQYAIPAELVEGRKKAFDRSKVIWAGNWENAEEGKQYFFADRIAELEENAEMNKNADCLQKVRPEEVFPFRNKGSSYAMVYPVSVDDEALDKSRLVTEENADSRLGRLCVFSDSMEALKKNLRSQEPCGVSRLQSFTLNAGSAVFTDGSGTPWRLAYDVTGLDRFKEGGENGEETEGSGDPRLMDCKNAAESETRTGRLCMFSDILEELESCVKEHRLGVHGILSGVRTFSMFPYTLERSNTGWKYAYDLTGLAWAEKPDGRKLRLTDVITVLNPEDAEIGKSYRFADDLGSLAEGSAVKGTLTRIEEGVNYPFYDGEGEPYSYIVPENN